MTACRCCRRRKRWPRPDTSPAHPGATGRATARDRAADRFAGLAARICSTDPQTSGGLLVACSAAAAEAICAEIQAAGYPRARIIGSVAAGKPAVRI